MEGKKKKNKIKDDDEILKIKFRNYFLNFFVYYFFFDIGFFS